MFNHKRNKTNAFTHVYIEMISLVMDKCVLKNQFSKSNRIISGHSSDNYSLFKNNLINVMRKN